MRLRRRYLPFMALLGASVAVIPAIASSAGPSTATVNGTESLMWSPMEVAITPGGTVTFEDGSSRVPHGVVWANVPETPGCSGVPIDEGRTNWTGKCTFNREGTYEYYCYVHGLKMSGKIFVNAAGTIPTTTETTPTGTTTTGTTTTSSTPTTTATTPTTTTPPTTTPMTIPIAPGTTSNTPNVTPSQTGTPSAGTSTYSGAAGSGVSSAMGGASPGGRAPKDSLTGGSLQLASSQRGNVHGSVEVAQAGSRLEINLLASSATVASSSHSATLAVGRLIKADIPAGRFSFRISLSKRARLALARRGRLVLTVKIALTPPGGTRLTRALVLMIRR
jgi:plastocyanin